MLGVRGVGPVIRVMEVVKRVWNEGCASWQGPVQQPSHDIRIFCGRRTAQGGYTRSVRYWVHHRSLRL